MDIIESSLLDMWFEIDTVSKPNSITIQRGQVGKSTKVKVFEHELSRLIVEQASKEGKIYRFEDKFAIIIIAYIHNDLKDVDNIVKAILDSMQKAHVIHNDRNCIASLPFKLSMDDYLFDTQKTTAPSTDVLHIRVCSGDEFTKYILEKIKQYF